MDRLIGLLIIVCAFVLCFYVGGWVLFFGGMFQITDAVRAGWEIAEIIKGAAIMFIAAPVAAIFAFYIFLLGIGVMSDF